MAVWKDLVLNWETKLIKCSKVCNKPNRNLHFQTLFEFFYSFGLFSVYLFLTDVLLSFSRSATFYSWRNFENVARATFCANILDELTCWNYRGLSCTKTSYWRVTNQALVGDNCAWINITFHIADQKVGFVQDIRIELFTSLWISSGKSEKDLICTFLQILFSSRVLLTSWIFSWSLSLLICLWWAVLLDVDVDLIAESSVALIVESNWDYLLCNWLIFSLQRSLSLSVNKSICILIPPDSS